MAKRTDAISIDAQKRFTPEQQCSFLAEHLKYRLDLIDMWCAVTLLHMQKQGGSLLVNLLATEKGCASVGVESMYNICSESGLIQTRLLLNFLGLSRDSSGGLGVFDKVSKARKDDVFVTMLTEASGAQLSVIVPREVKCLPSVTDWDSKEYPIDTLLADLIQDANKAAGHLTLKEKPDPGPRWFLGALFVRVLVERAVYGRLSIPVPAKYPWTTRVLPGLIDSPFAAYLQLVECIFDRQLETFPRPPQPDITDAKESDQ